MPTEEEKPRKQKYVHRFVAEDGSKLTVVASEGKGKFNVHVTMKKPGNRAQTGCVSYYENFDDAKKQAQKLADEAKVAGWELRKEGARNIARGFQEIPVAPGAEPPRRREDDQEEEHRPGKPVKHEARRH